MKVYYVLIRIASSRPHRGDSNEYKQHTIFNIIHIITINYAKYNFSFLLMNLHIICTNALVGDHLVLKNDPFLEHQGRIGR